MIPSPALPQTVLPEGVQMQTFQALIAKTSRQLSSICEAQVATMADAVDVVNALGSSAALAPPLRQRDSSCITPGNRSLTGSR